ncbi:hypothetical protein RFI_22867 [Reticulomyxa filosa]|uniref:Vacuolar protein-sorting-associated protein 36 n=1 Tax=Reticulomyxa filosa TaxID=46433 RepID=X6MM45_RETFI|nr:hypothetical protein RFI_22867 [Reticulomyxa filosa]|eukprot:ETO14507.1 hypothetical protein RFI_22867 [Reticulomyxa filosa]
MTTKNDFDDYLDPYSLTAGGRPQLEADEVELQYDNSVSIYYGFSELLSGEEGKKGDRQGNEKMGQGTMYIDNISIVMDERVQKTRHSFKKHQIMRNKAKEEKGGEKERVMSYYPNSFRKMVHSDSNIHKVYVGKKMAKVGLNSGQTPIIRHLEPPLPGYMVLSFHTNGRDDFVKKMTKALQSRSWQKQETEEKREFQVGMAGIRGIMRETRERQEKTKQVVTEAFQDLEALMIKAKDMVALANRLAASQEAKDNQDEFDNMLQNLGIASPVTKEAAGSQYHNLLARQLADFLVKPLERSGGMMTLTDVYCLFNRARGSELVSPDDILASCKLMSRLELPLKMRKFEESEVLVVELLAYSDDKVASRILQIIEKQGSIDELALSQATHVSINLARYASFTRIFILSLVSLHLFIVGCYLHMLRLITDNSYCKPNKQNIYVGMKASKDYAFIKIFSKIINQYLTEREKTSEKRYFCWVFLEYPLLCALFLCHMFSKSRDSTFFCTVLHISPVLFERKEICML